MSITRKGKVKVDDVRNRIVSVERIKANEIDPHPGNWRDHPDAQAQAIAGVMQEVGDVGVLLAWKSERNGGKLTLIDGHLRQGIAPDHEYMVAVTDLSDDEADYVLATHDPLAAMAQADKAALDALLSSVESGDAAVQQMLTSLAARSGIIEPLDPMDEWQGMPEFEQEDLSAFKSLIVHFGTQEAVDSFAELVGQKITENTKSIWYPKAIPLDMKGVIYHDESPGGTHAS